MASIPRAGDTGSFRLVTLKGHVIFRTASPVTYVIACDDARKRAEALGAASIIVIA
ncbi:hypothetical protein [Bradyrhizobium jicamae]|uniref:hypothetical protein n=1 Tax=Bradyrhizobium jicamae TaxID=280332 RepID=UPI001BA6CE3B|nr:hypothetical protein [Bradyrhizobium jicamae]MBR0938223.1 hypothetical protein [Bradyrhizobium jicamae]